MNASVPSRRQFLIKAALVVAAVPFAGSGLVGTAFAQALKPLPADNPTAIALKYVDDAAKTKEPTFKPGSNCANCQFFTAASGACTLFPGFAVAAKGWCTAWAKKA
ncbi:high-potential iron-sulfur protein [Arenimonas sp. MALMAid1274]|uniref:high-potential iron-sulfur protein n=1 Tax=Arenimonas sp. MALMAid1274 TaxID=3411630 RepID=UPI003BA17EE1